MFQSLIFCTFTVSDFDETRVELIFTSDTTIRCASVGIQDDSILENNEVFLVELESNDTDVIVTELSSAAVVILDNDSEFVTLLRFEHSSTQASECSVSYPGVNINLEQDTYTIAENEGFIGICVILDLNNEIERNVELSLTAGPITASGVLKF